MVTKMENADKVGDSETIFRIVKLLMSVREETSRRTRTFDVVPVQWIQVRSRLLQWVGHILRMDENRTGMVQKSPETHLRKQENW